MFWNYFTFGIKWRTVWRSWDALSSCVCLACSIWSWLFLFDRFSSCRMLFKCVARRPLAHLWSSLVSESSCLCFSSIILAIASSWGIFRMVFSGPFRKRPVALITVVAHLKVFMAFIALLKPALASPDFAISLSFVAV